MKIKGLLLESIVLLAIITCLVVAANTIQIRHDAIEYVNKLQEQYLDATYDIYKDEIIGDILVGDNEITQSLFEEISKRRGIGLSVIHKDDHLTFGNILSSMPSKEYKLDLGTGNEAKLSLYLAEELGKQQLFKELKLSLLVVILVLGLGFIYLFYRFNKKLLAPLSDLVTHLKSNELEAYTVKPESIQEIRELGETLKRYNIDIREKAIFEADANAAKRLAHDIGSPVGSLTLLLSSASTSIPEKYRILMRVAIQRITDIANSLYSQSMKTRSCSITAGKIENLMITSLVDLLVSEKRIQIKNQINIQIDSDFEKSYGLFAELDSTEFKRTLSNLINNSIEAFDDRSHRVHISVEKNDRLIKITLHDDGKGIPENIINRIGQYGFSYGKESNGNAGMGLGVYYAIKTVESFGGTFSIVSKVNQGTTVIIQLPQSQTPSWFVKELKLVNINKIVILDDDQSIHSLWSEKFTHLEEKNIEIFYFLSGNQFRNYCLSQTRYDNMLFLMDFELLNQNYTGLDLIREFNIAEQAILITSYYEDSKVKIQAERNGVKIIPKSMVAFIPIT